MDSKISTFLCKLKDGLHWETNSFFYFCVWCNTLKLVVTVHIYFRRNILHRLYSVHIFHPRSNFPQPFVNMVDAIMPGTPQLLEFHHYVYVCNMCYDHHYANTKSERTLETIPKSHQLVKHKPTMNVQLSAHPQM